MKALPRVVALSALMIACLFAVSPPSLAQVPPDRSQVVLQTWFRLILELVRHTPTYSPPVASRAFAYIAVTAYEAEATGSDRLRSLAGQLTGLKTIPQREAGQVYDDTVVLEAAMEAAAHDYFDNTGPTGQHAMAALGPKLRAQVEAGVAADVVARSEAYGKAVAAQILAWSADDGGAVIENMGFPLHYTLTPGPGHWVPTSLIIQQQAPLLPDWGKNRPFAMPTGASCDLPPPPAYSEDKDSEFYKQALEVYQTVKSLTPEQTAIARYWSDDAMLSKTPPGHWIAIAMQILDDQHADMDRSVDVLARLSVAMADAFIGCWQTKYEYDLVRPVTYIRRLIDPKLDPILITPPFPEYPSGHSSQSAAAAEVLTALFGDNFAFEDTSKEDDGMPARRYPSFRAASDEAAISRLYGGIHFRAAIENGQQQGRCIGAYAVALQTTR